MADFVERSVRLEYQQGASDKVYTAAIYAVGEFPDQAEFFKVEVAWGRRGQSLRRMDKTPDPVSLIEAITIYNRVVREKINKGYVRAGIVENITEKRHPIPQAVSSKTTIKSRQTRQPVKNEAEYYQGYMLCPDERDNSGDVVIIDNETNTQVATIAAKKRVRLTMNTGKKLIDKKRILDKKIEALLNE